MKKLHDLERITSCTLFPQHSYSEETTTLQAAELEQQKVEKNQIIRELYSFVVHSDRVLPNVYFTAPFFFSSFPSPFLFCFVK